MKSYLLLSGFTFLSFYSFAQQQNPRYSKVTERRIAQVEQHLNGWVRESGKGDFTLTERMAYYHVNGVSVAVINNFKVDWVRGYGWADKNRQQPVTVNTAFQAGSVSKTVNAIALMQLVQEGKLQLDQDINARLKTWQFPYDSVSQGVKITLRHLLSHRAGLNVSGFAGYERSDTIPDIYQILDGRSPAESSPVRSRLVPGSAFRYSGGGIMISQLLAMDADASPYNDLMKRRLFKPLGMKHSSFDEDQLPLKATGYYWDGKELPGQYRFYPEAAAAGLWTTPADLAKLLIAYQQAYSGLSYQLLSKQAAREMATLDPHTEDDRHKSALGFFIDQRGGRTYLTHDGKVEGYLSLFFIDPEKGNGLVVMNNSNDAAGMNIEIANSIAQVYGWKGFNIPEERKTIAIKTDSLAVYNGTYVNGSDTLTLMTRQEGLFFASSFSYYGRPQLVTFLSKEQFYVYEEEFFTDYWGYKNQYFAKRGADGQVTGIVKRVKGEPEKVFVRE